jgi:hypothetical protein
MPFDSHGKFSPVIKILSPFFVMQERYTVIFNLNAGTNYVRSIEVKSYESI